LLSLARRCGPLGELSSDRVANVYMRSMIARMTGLRIRAALAGGGMPGPEASVGKLYATETMRLTSEVALHLLGRRMTADSVAEDYAWTEHLLGAPGYRIAGGSDEIQRTIIAERMLDLPRETGK
jgi:alkylation response protein AidB-like acyl-CoA dehydrogenase